MCSWVTVIQSLVGDGIHPRGRPKFGQGCPKVFMLSNVALPLLHRLVRRVTSAAPNAPESTPRSLAFYGAVQPAGKSAAHWARSRSTRPGATSKMVSPARWRAGCSFAYRAQSPAPAGPGSRTKVCSWSAARVAFIHAHAPQCRSAFWRPARWRPARPERRAWQKCRTRWAASGTMTLSASLRTSLKPLAMQTRRRIQHDMRGALGAVWPVWSSPTSQVVMGRCCGRAQRSATAGRTAGGRRRPASRRGRWDAKVAR